MDHPSAVDLFQSIHNRHDNDHHSFYRKPPIVLHILLQVLPLYKLHNDISGIVFGKIIVNRDKIIFPGIFCHILGFIKEILHSLFIKPFCAGITGHFKGYRCLSIRHRIRKVFLDRDVHIQFKICTVIRYPETSLPYDTVNSVLSMEDRTGFKIKRIIRSVDQFPPPFVSLFIDSNTADIIQELVQTHINPFVP